MYGNVQSKYDISIIFICFCILIFVSVMINHEIERRENKYRDGIIAVLVLLVCLGLGILASRLKTFEYVITLLSIILWLCFLIKDIISIYLKRRNSKFKNIAVKIKHSGVANTICIIIIVIIQLSSEQGNTLMNIFVLIILLADLPMDYLLNNFLNVYENGIMLGTFLFPKKIIPYEKIENLNFEEYDKNKFILKIYVEKRNKKSPYTHRIKADEKDEFISFVRNFIEEEKITICSTIN